MRGLAKKTMNILSSVLAVLFALTIVAGIGMAVGDPTAKLAAAISVQAE